jgi:hypothetical protein
VPYRACARQQHPRPGLSGLRTHLRRFPCRGDGCRERPDRGSRDIAKPVHALVRPLRIQLRCKRSRSRPRTRRLPTRSSDRSRQPQPLQRVQPVDPSGQPEAEHGDTASAFDHVALSIRNFYDSGNTSSMRSPSSPLFSTGSDATNRLPPSPVSRSVPSPKQPPLNYHRDRPPSRCSRRPDLQISGPQGRNDDHRRNGYLRLRPNRPGPSRTESRLEIDHICDTHRSPCKSGDSARRDVSEVSVTTTCLVFRPCLLMRRLPQIKMKVAEGPPSWHRLGPVHMSFEAKRFRHRAVAPHQVSVGEIITAGTG